MNTCRTCKHYWDKEEKACLKINSLSLNARAWIASDEGITLKVSPDFGCTLHEPIPSTDNTESIRK
jgi:hypothetical protein